MLYNTSYFIILVIVIIILIKYLFFPPKKYVYYIFQYILKLIGIDKEGSISNIQKDNIKNLFINKFSLKEKFIIGEVGFNRGHSSMFFLDTFPNSKLYSFDICSHTYCNSAYEMVKNKYKERFTLIKGDSTQTLVEFQKHNILFDIVFIDGNHLEDIPERDLYNFMKLSKTGTVIIMDDCKKDINSVKYSFKFYPSIAFQKYVDMKKITPLLYKDDQCIGIKV